MADRSPVAHSHPTTTDADLSVCAQARSSIASRRDAMVERLAEWADLNTGSDNAPGLRAFAETLLDYARFLPAEPETLTAASTGAPCALRWRKSENLSVGGRPRVLLNGHIDTVFAPDHPFQTCRIDSATGRIHGPGVADMKGGLVILFAALEAFLETDLRDHLDWEILLTFDEEIGSFQNREHLEAAAQRHDLGITFESSPAPEELIRNRLGTGRIDVFCQGQAAHAGRNFSDGRNAIVALADLVSRINALNTSIPGVLINIAQIAGGGPINVVPDRATAALNVRAPDEATQATLTQQLHAIANEVVRSSGCAIDVTGGFTRPPKVADAATETLLQAWRAVARPLGLDLYWRDTGGASDGNILQAAGLPIVDNLGAVGDHLHSDQEYAECDSLVSRAQLTATFLTMLASGGLDENGERFIDRIRRQRNQPA